MNGKKPNRLVNPKKINKYRDNSYSGTYQRNHQRDQQRYMYVLNIIGESVLYNSDTYFSFVDQMKIKGMKEK